MLMAERRAAGKNEGAPPRDLFDLMDAARDPETGEAFTDEQLGDQVATMILAGHETTATALFWSLYLLALDPATQEELAAEVNGASVNGALDIERLKFTRAVVDETMRLYPPAFLIARAAAAPDTIAGMPVRKNDIVLIAPWLLHRHEKLWRDPNAFIPSRFMTGTPPDRFAYLPFGVGARVCIGAHFALVEATLALAKMIGAFRVELVDREPVMPIGVVTTQPDRSPMFAHHALGDRRCVLAHCVIRSHLGFRHERHPGPVFGIEADRRSGGGRCDRAPDREGRGSRAQPDQRAGFLAADRARRGAGDFRLSPCLAARPVRSDLERVVSRLRRRARCPRDAEVAASRRLSLRSVRCGYEASVDEQVEVAFTVSPRVRRIAAHDPNSLPIWEYFKQVFWSSGDRLSTRNCLRR